MFAPRSIAIVGAGTQYGAQILGNAVEAGYKGKIFPVDPGMEAAHGLRVYPDMAGLPESPELTVLAVAEDEAGDALRAVAARGCRAVVVPGRVPADFARQATEAGNVRVLGPRSFGIAVPALGLNITRSHMPVPRGKLAFVSQSVALCRTLLDWAGPNAVGFSHMVGIGGNINFGFAATLDWLSRDPAAAAILLDIQLVRNRRAFLSSARAAAAMRPVVAMFSGRGRSEEAVFVAALRRAGVLCVTGLEELLEAAETLTRTKPVRGPGLAIATNARGPARLAVTALQRSGGELAQFEPGAGQTLSMFLPAGVRVDNPLYLPGVASNRLAEAAAVLSATPGVGGVLVLHAPPEEGDANGMLTSEALKAAGVSAKAPVLFCALGETTGGPLRLRLAQAGLPVFATPEAAVGAFCLLVKDRANRAVMRELPSRDVVKTGADRAAVTAILQRVRAASRTELMEDEALAVLAAYGISTVTTHTAQTPEDAAAAAEAIGFPVVLKVRSPDLKHKTEVGGVVLGLRAKADVEKAAQNLCAAVAQKIPEVKLAGLLVQRQVGGGERLQIRVLEDPVFGPAIQFGHGGTEAEIIDDTAVEMPPLNLALARSLVERTRVSRLLHGWRDHASADVNAVLETLVRVSQLVVDFPEIATLDMNPLFADAQGVVAVDAGISLRPPGSVSQLAFPPYPEELIGTYMTPAGEQLTIRPIRPEDADEHMTLFTRLSPDDIRYRFFSSLKELSPMQIVRMTQIDFDREIAFVAVRESTGATVGVSRLTRDIGANEGEYAILVEQHMRGQGVARHLMTCLIDWAREQGIEKITGQILAENQAMLGFVRSLGFKTARMPDDPDLVEATFTVIQPKQDNN